MKDLIILTKSLHSVRGLSKWASAVDSVRNTQLKARKKQLSQGTLAGKRWNTKVPYN
jgi:hypothetical protein